MKKFLISGPRRRLDLVLSELLGISRTRASSLIKSGLVFLNRKRIFKPAQQVSCGDVLEIEEAFFERLKENFSESGKLVAVHVEDKPFEVLYEDDDLIVLNKSAPLVVHPAPGHEKDTLLNYLVVFYPQILKNFGEANLRAGVVHRLDMETSGLMILALNEEARFALSTMIAERNFSRKYLAITTGAVREQRFCVEGYMGRSKSDRKKMALYRSELPSTRWSKTCFRLITRNPGAGPRGYSFLEAELFTGRTHQVRVHLSSGGFPVAGDLKYGGRDELWFSIAGGGRIALHAFELSFVHPFTKKSLKFRCAPPDYFLEFAERVFGKILLNF